MRTLIEIPIVYYDEIMKHVPEESPLYARFKNGFIVKPSIQIFCEDQELEDALRTIERYCPREQFHVSPGVDTVRRLT